MGSVRRWRDAYYTKCFTGRRFGALFGGDRHTIHLAR
jgi:hypothetical protein